MSFRGLGELRPNLRRIQQRLTGPFARNVFVFSGATAFGQLLSLAATPLITRLYTPEDVGQFALYVALAGILTTVATLRLELAVPIADQSDVATVLRAGLCMVGTAAGLVLIAVLFAPIRSAIPQLPGFAWFLIPVGVLVAGVNNLAASTCLRDEFYSELARKQIWQSSVRTSSQIGLGTASVGGSGLILGHILGFAAGTYSLVRRSDNFLVALRFRSQKLPVARALQKYRKYAVWSMPATLLNGAAVQLPALILVAAFPTSFVGQFGLAQRLTTAPLTLLATSTARVFLGSIAAKIRRGDRNLVPSYRRMIILLAVVGAPLFIILFVVGPKLFAAVFGAEWEEAGKLVRILSPMLYSNFVFGPIADTLTAVQRQDWQFRWDVTRTTAVLICLVAVPASGATGRVTIAFYSAIMALWYLVHGGLTYRALVIHERSRANTSSEIARPETNDKS